MDRAYYHLHPEFVNDREQATVCNDCLASLKKNEIPKLSIANGIDFGDYNRIGLTKPNTFELSIIGIVTAYFNIIKLTSNKGRSDYTNVKFLGHLICFKTTAPEVSYDLLSFQRLQKLIKLHFIVGANEIDELMERSRGSAHLQGRSFVVLQWLRILGKVNRLYRNIPSTRGKSILKP